MIGTAASVTGIDSRTIYYLLLGPGFGLLGVLAMWGFARTARANAPVVVLIAAFAFLYFQRRNSSFGRAALPHVSGQGRSWCCSSSLGCGREPPAFARSGAIRDLIWMALGAIAAIGLSSSGAFSSLPS